jgi:hypothetical protein
MTSESQRTMMETQIYGSLLRPRMKWSCVSCRRRNDHALRPPLGVEMVACKFCRRTSCFVIRENAGTQSSR